MAFSISSKLKLLFVFLLVLSLTSLSLSTANLSLDLKDTDTITDIHELFPKYNLPIGLLPANVKSYNLFPEDKSFTIELTHHCYVHFEDQLVYYDTNIKGKLDYGKVYDVSGIQAKKLFIWVSVNGMVVDEKSNMIEFHVGPFTEKMPAEDFKTIPICEKKGFQQKESASI